MMGLLKRIYDNFHPPVKSKELSTPETQSEAAMALAKANTDLTAVQAQEPRVKAVVNELREKRERNHFAEMLEASMRPTG